MGSSGNSYCTWRGPSYISSWIGLWCTAHSSRWFCCSTNTTASPSMFLHTLHTKEKDFMPVPISKHVTQSSSFPSNLHSSQYVFVCQDCHRSPLERPWSHEPQVWRDSLWCIILLCFVYCDVVLINYSDVQSKVRCYTVVHFNIYTNAWINFYGMIPLKDI